MVSVSPVFQLIWVVPALSIETNMTCKVFRAMALRSADGKQNSFVPPVEAWTTGVSVRELETSEPQIQTMDIELESA